MWVQTSAMSSSKLTTNSPQEPQNLHWGLFSSRCKKSCWIIFAAKQNENLVPGKASPTVISGWQNQRQIRPAMTLSQLKLLLPPAINKWLLAFNCQSMPQPDKPLSNLDWLHNSQTLILAVPHLGSSVPKFPTTIFSKTTTESKSIVHSANRRQNPAANARG